MQIVFDEARRLLDANERFLLATVIATHGSTPQKAGARLLVRADGGIIGTLGGGCVEADVRIAARRLLRDDVGETGASVMTFHLNEDIAFQDGLVCGGSMDILLEPTLCSSAGSGRERLDDVLRAYRGERDCAWAVRFAAAETDRNGETGGPPTGRVLGQWFSRADGEAVGSLADADLEEQARAQAKELMPRGLQAWLSAPDGSRVYLETFTRPATVVIAGGGHVGKAVYTLATFLGFRTFIVDDREAFANAERFPEADTLVVDDFDRGLASLGMGPNHYVVVATRGHKLDDAALLAAARSDAGYIGLLGSKRKAVLLFRELYLAGIPEARLSEIRAPVGLDLGGRQPEDIALSILAEISAVRHGRAGGALNLMDDRVLARIRQLGEREASRAGVTGATTDSPPP